MACGTSKVPHVSLNSLEDFLYYKKMQCEWTCFPAANSKCRDWGRGHSLKSSNKTPGVCLKDGSKRQVSPSTRKRRCNEIQKPWLENGGGVKRRRGMHAEFQLRNFHEEYAIPVPGNGGFQSFSLYQGKVQPFLHPTLNLLKQLFGNLILYIPRGKRNLKSQLRVMKFSIGETFLSMLISSGAASQAF